MAAKKKAVAKRSSTGVSKWKSRMEQMKESFGAREKDPAGNRISIKGGKFTLQKVDLGDVMEVVVLDYSMLNSYYIDDYDPDNVTPPNCFAIARLEDDLKPVEGCSDPQSPACDGCWANEFGSDGKGKACKNKRRVAVLRLDAVEDAIAGKSELTADDVALIEFGGTSLASWTAYVNKVAKRLNLPAFMVRTEVSFDNSTAYPKLEWNILADQIEYDDVTGEALMNIIDGLEDTLLAVPNLTPSEDADDPAKASRAKPQASRSKKTASKKKASARRSRLA